MNEQAPTPVRAALIVLVRLPRPGRVKTRLAATIGDGPATVFYRLCAERLFRESARLPPAVRSYLFYADPEDEAAMRAWAGRGFRYAAQHGEDFGARMANAFRTVFAEGVEKAIIVGSDIPALTAAIMLEALRQLDGHDLVIGPDNGGGYYLLGMKEFHPALFRGITWGTDRVFAETMAVIARPALTVSRLPILIDVDTESDLRRWLESRMSG